MDNEEIGDEGSDVECGWRDFRDGSERGVCVEYLPGREVCLIARPKAPSPQQKYAVSRSNPIGLQGVSAWKN